MDVESEELLEDVDGRCLAAGCDDTLRHTWRWAAEHRVTPAAMSRLLRSLGLPKCDCELVVRLRKLGDPPDP